MKSRIAVILVNWNSYEVTNDCIQSLKKATYPWFTTVVVDNGSTDGSGERLRSMYPDIVYLPCESNTGFTGGNNTGMQYALDNGFDFAMMLNNDTFVEPDFLESLVTHMDEFPETGAVQSRIYFNHDRSLVWSAGCYYNAWTGFTYSRGEGKKTKAEYLLTQEVDWITGCAFLIRSDVLRETGLLPLNMFIYSEDVDLSFRIRQKGYRLMYIPDSIVYHIAGKSNKSKVKGKEGFVKPIVHYLNQRNRLWLLKRYTRFYQAPTVIVVNFIYLVVVLGYFMARGRFEKLKAVVKAIGDGLSGSIKYTW